MSQDIKQALRVWMASAPQTEYCILVLEIAHSAMSRTWYLWPERVAGDVVTEAGQTVHVLCCNLAIERAGTPLNLDQVWTVVIDTTDIDDLFREELDRIPLDTTERVRIVVREYLSGDLSEPQTVARLQAETLPCVRGKATFTATAPRFNVTRTGLLYSPRDIPMLRSFV